MLGGPLDDQDATARSRERRRQRRKRQVRRRRAVALAVLLAAVAGITLGARSVGGGRKHAQPVKTAAPVRKRRPTVAVTAGHVPVPQEVRGVHVTMALASLRGKLQQYLALPGLNTVELDIKDENGRVGFVPSAVPLARRTGAAGPYYRAKWAARLAHASGIYLIGRIVTFEDPVLSEQRPQYAIRTSDGSRWFNNSGLGWTNPYDRRGWEYNVDPPVGAGKAGVGEKPFGYRRVPRDGGLSLCPHPPRPPHPLA